MWKLQPANIYAADEIPISWGAPCPTGNAPAAAVSGESDVKKNWGQCLRIFNNDQYYTCGNTKSDIKHTNGFFIRNKNANAPLSVIKCD